MQRAAWGLVGAVLLAACAHAGPTSAAAARVHPAAAADTAAVTVHVVNDYAVPVEVRAFAMGTSYLLGRVFPGLTSRFTLPQAALGAGGRVALAAAPADGAPMIRSSELVLKPGDVVDFKVTPDLVSSSAMVRQ